MSAAERRDLVSPARERRDCVDEDGSRGAAAFGAGREQGTSGNFPEIRELLRVNTRKFQVIMEEVANHVAVLRDHTEKVRVNTHEFPDFREEVAEIRELSAS